ncbi:MAG: choice-of-anchor D domain-containing protein [bacterium]
MKKAICFITFLLILVNCHYADCQSLSVFKVDASAFPIIKAKVYAFDATGNQIKNLSPSDFELKENGITRNVIDLSCPNTKPAQRVSIAMSIDVSGSMFNGENGEFPVELGKVTAKVLCKSVSMPPSEFALQQCDKRALIIQDFTTDRSKILDKIDPISARGDNNFEEQLLNSLTGLLNLAKKGINKKVAVLYTDAWWKALTTSQLQSCKDTCAKYDIVFFAVIYSRPGAEPDGIKKSLQSLANETGGYLYDGITSTAAAEAIAYGLRQVTQNGNPCEIKWESQANCQLDNENLEIKLNSLSEIIELSYKPSINSLANLELNPKYVQFIGANPGTLKDTIIKVTAHNSDFNVTNIRCSNSSFSINPTSFLLYDGQSKDIKVSFLPVDSNYSFNKITFESNICSFDFYSSGGFPEKKAIVKSLRLTHPNGGEEFIIGSDTLITWEGISEFDQVKLEYSIDKGTTWNIISKKANGLKYIWRNIPKPISNECLIKISQIRIYGQIDSTPSIEWQRTIGGSSVDYSHSIQQAKDGGYIIAGSSSSLDGEVCGGKGVLDDWIVKLNPLGFLEWQFTWGGSSCDEAKSIKQTIDGGFIIAGYSFSIDGDIIGNKGEADYCIIKLDQSGKIQWQKNIGGSAYDKATDIQQTSDLGYIIVGFTRSHDGDLDTNYGIEDAWIVKLDQMGAIEWQKSIGGSQYDWARSVEQTNDGGFIIAGSTNSADGDIKENKGKEDAWIIKLNQFGSIEWQKTMGGSKDDAINSIHQTFDKGYIIAGMTRSNDNDVNGFNGGDDSWVVKLNQIGDIEWQKTMGGYSRDQANSVQQTSDSGYIVAGYYSSSNGNIRCPQYNYNYWIFKLNQKGTLEWQKILGGSLSDQASCIQQTYDGGYIVLGNSESSDGDVDFNKGITDCWIIKLSAEDISIQEDESDSVFSIVAPMAQANDIDMKKCLVGSSKDSVITDFVRNISSYKFSVNLIYFSGPDAQAFNLIAGKPKYILEPKECKTSEINFTPNRIGIHSATINIITQSDTIRQSIQGEGVEPQLEVISNFLDFGKVEILHENTIQDTALIKNISNIPVTIIDVVQLGPDKTQFEVINGGGSFTLQPNESRKLTLRFKPIFGGRTSGQLGFEYNGTGSPAVVQLFGTGIGGLVYILNDSAYAGEKRNLKLVMANINPEGLAEIAPNFEAKIRFQNTILVPQDRSNSVMLNDSVYMKISGTIGSNIELAQIPVIAGLGNVEETSIDIVDIILKDNLGIKVDYNFEKNSGTFKLLGICREGGTRLFNPTGKVEILQINPNPASDDIEISFNLIESGSTVLSIFNSNGVKMNEFNLVGEIGLKTINLDAREFANGLYFIQLQTPTVITNQKLMILK